MKEQQFGEYRFRQKRLWTRKKEVLALLSRTYWARERPWKQTKIALRNSLCFGVFDAKGKLVGMTRVLTDYATAFYLADVVVQEDLRGKGIGKAFLAYILSDTRFCNTKGILLTGDAQGFYEQFDFVRSGERCMLREYDKRQRGSKTDG